MTGSGMGCPDWPKCFGSWIPPTTIADLPVNYKEIYSDSDPEMLNMIDGNLKKAGNNYWKLGKSHFPRTYKATQRPKRCCSRY